MPRLKHLLMESARSMKINLNLSQDIFLPKFFPYLQDYSHKFEIYYGGAAAGKSYFVAQKIIIKSLASVRNTLIVRKTLVS